MPSSEGLTFRDPDEYAAAIRATKAELTVTSRGQFVAKRMRIDLHRLWMQRFSENLPRVLHTANMAGRAGFLFLTQPESGLLAGGLELLSTNILRYSEATDHHHRSAGSISFGAMSLSLEDTASVGVMASLDLSPPKNPLTVTPAPSAIAKLHRLHAAAGHLAEEAPEIIVNPDAAHGLEQALLEALVGCLGDCEAHDTSLAHAQHEIVMRRFRRLVEESDDQPLYITEVCKAIRVSARTLQVCCHEHLGMGPKRYLVLRRMRLARRALRQADPAATSVTDIATRYGFWQLGRFAVEYHSLFDDTPSATLHRQIA